MQLKAQPLRFAPQLGQFLVGGGLRVLPDLAVLLLSIPQEAACAHLQCGCFRGFFQGARTGVLGGGALAGDLLEHRLCLSRPRRDIGTCRVENVVRHAEALGDEKGIRAAWHADHQPVGWRQRLDVEFDARVLHAWGGFGVALQLGIVRSSDHICCPLAQKIEQRSGEGRPFLRIGARAEFVEEDQRAAVRVAQHADHA